MHLLCVEVSISHFVPTCLVDLEADHLSARSRFPAVNLEATVIGESLGSSDSCASR